MARHRKSSQRKGSSKAGRPRKEGDRYPSGDLRPPPPSAVTIAKRKAGDSEAGEHPLDFALSQGWLTERDHQAANAYRAAYGRSHIGGPRMSHGGLCEVVPSEELRMNWSQLSDEEITGIFDQVFNITAGPENPEQMQASALALWKRLNMALSAEERDEMFKVCVLGSWPFWMPKKAADHAMGAQDQRKIATLINALGSVSRALRPARPKGDTITSVPHKATRKGRAEQAVRYENQHGEPIKPASKHGKPFEVTVLTKRA